MSMILAAANTTANITKLIDGTMYFALAACVAAIFISGTLWAVGSKAQNPGQELTGKRGLFVALVAAFFIGSIPAIMGFVDLESRTADSNKVIQSPQPSGNTGGAGCTLAAAHTNTGGC